jgi:ATP-dependent DNA helicase DinG
VLELLSGRQLPNGRQSWEATDSALDVAVTVLSDALLALSEQAAALQAGEALEQCTDRLVRLRDTLETIATAASDEGARLVEATPRGFSLQLLPFDVGPRFRQLALSRRCAWVFTSATLTVGDGFAHFASRLGLSDEAATLCIDSPFDYPRQARLLLPQGLPDPADLRHGGAVVELALRLIEASGGGAFLLFTSLRALERAAQTLRQRWSAAGPRTLLVQGEAPRESLLRRFREDGHAVLLGSASFWEGVDVKGDALRLVIIDKLPFSPPDDPLTKARLDHLRSTGGNPFADHQLPEAALALKQGVGRLVRSEDDRGVVVLCDSRLTSRGYGRQLLAALPPMTVTRDIAEAEAFLRDLRAGGAA